MKVGIDARLLERKMTGIGRYVFNLVKNIPDCGGENEYVLFTYGGLDKERFPGTKVVSTLNFLPRGIFQKFISPLWMNFILPRFLRREKVDVFFSPNHVLPFLRGKAKNVVVILDLFNLVDSQFHSFLYRSYVGFTLPNSIKKSAAIITISEASKRDIVKFFKVPEDKIKVIYLAAEEKFKPRSLNEDEKKKLREKYHLPDRFILYVGVIEERKNIAGILKIADSVFQRTNIPTVLVGRVGHGGKKYTEEMENRRSVLYRGFVEEKDLPLLYNLSSAFVFPSWYEGFGIPPLEAMQSGVPVVASNTSSLPEVIGDGGITLPPDDYAGFADALEKILKDGDFHSHLVEQGLLQAARFSFKKAACETAAVFNRMKET